MAHDRAHVSIGGVPVRVDWSFWLLAVLLGYQAREGWLLVAWVAVVLVSVLVHELGHAFTLRLFEQRPHVVLYAFGGVTFGSAPHRSRAESIIVSIAGPITALILLGLPAYLLRDSSWALQSYDRYVVVHDIAWVNIVWSIANLMPVLPLDGGNVTASLVGERTARIISIAVAAAGALYFLETGNQFGALFAALFAVMNFTSLQQPSGARAAAGSSTPSPVTLADIGHGDDVVARVTQLLRATPDGPSRAGAFQRQLHLAGRFPEAATVAQMLYTDGRAGRQQAAFDAAAALARAGRPDEALWWLDRAVDEGLRNGPLLDGEPDLAPLRSSPGWWRVRQRVP